MWVNMKNTCGHMYRYSISYEISVWVAYVILSCFVRSTFYVYTCAYNVDRPHISYIYDETYAQYTLSFPSRPLPSQQTESTPENALTNVPPHRCSRPPVLLRISFPYVEQIARPPEGTCRSTGNWTVSRATGSSSLMAKVPASGSIVRENNRPLFPKLAYEKNVTRVEGVDGPPSRTPTP